MRSWIKERFAEYGDCGVDDMSLFSGVLFNWGPTRLAFIDDASKVEFPLARLFVPTIVGLVIQLSKHYQIHTGLELLLYSPIDSWSIICEFWV